MSREQVINRVDTTISAPKNLGQIRNAKKVVNKRFQNRNQPPLNILGCFALIHAVRSLKSDRRFEP